MPVSEYFFIPQLASLPSDIAGPLVEFSEELELPSSQPRLTSRANPVRVVKHIFLKPEILFKLFIIGFNEKNI
jgi:hypothetical protein